MWVDPGGDHGRTLLETTGSTGTRRVLVRDRATAGRYRTMVPTDGDLAVQTAGELAERTLDATGLTVPDGIAHAGRSIPPGNGPTRSARDWVARLDAAADTPSDRLATVRDPAALAATVRALLMAGIVPGPNGLTDEGRRRLRGDPAAIETRLAVLAERVPAVDPDRVSASRDGSWDALEAFAEDLLVGYLRWCLDTGRVPPALRVALAASTQVADPVEQVLLDGGAFPPAALLALAARSATDRLTVVAGGSADARLAWRPSKETVARHVAGAAAVPVEDVSVSTIEVDPAPVDWVRATDPVAVAVEHLGERAGDGAAPVDLVVAPTAATARRCLRLGGGGATRLARGGRVSVTRTAPAVLGLAWLRIVTGRRADRGWAVVLEHEGCSPGDIEAWLDGDDRPAALAAFRSDLKRLADGPAIVAAVARRYQLDPRATGAVLELLSTRAGGAVAPGETLAVLARADHPDDRVHLEPPPTDAIQVVTEPGSGSPNRAIHVLEDPVSSRGSLVYAPPLGLFATRSLVTVSGERIELEDTAWTATAAVRDPPAERAVRAARVTAGRAVDGVTLVGRSPLVEHAAGRFVT